jgi:poly(hydroxyalkanoate) depolymerase family esterase
MARRPVTATRLVVVLGAVLFAAAVAFAPTRSARADELSAVSGFGSNPGNLSMYTYRPAGVGSGRPLVLALHGCTQNARGYHQNAGWKKYADLWRFTVVYPEQKFVNNGLSCFNWFVEGDISRGQGEALSIKQMVDHAVANYGADPTRVFITGLSAGGAMVAVMLAIYPDVFAGGSVIGGLPYRCAPPALTSTCQYSGVNKAPNEWGDAVRAAHPGFTGRRPAVAIWHGTSDFTVVPANADESRDQWTNVHGVSQTPTSTAQLPGNTTLNKYGNDQVRLYKVAGMGHGTPVNPGTASDQCGATAAFFLSAICSTYADAVYFGLSEGDAPNPTTPAPNPTTPGPDPQPVCATANNYEHVRAGRAYHSAGHAYAKGSNQDLGLYNVFVTTTLKQTGADRWVLANEAC